MRLLFKRLRRSRCFTPLVGTCLTFAPRALAAATFAALMGLLLSGCGHAMFSARSVCGLWLNMGWTLRCLCVFGWRGVIRRTCGCAFTAATATASAFAAFTCLTGRTLACVAVNVVS